MTWVRRVSDTAVANEQYAVVHFSRAVTASQEVLCDDTGVIGIQGTGREHADGDWLLLEEDAELVICSSVVFSVADLANVGLVFELSIADLALASAMTKLPVIVLFEKSMLTDVLESLVHPASGTTIVGRITVEELLDRQLGQLFVAA